jgi:predicted HicB family RNase H-like nuclease
VITQDSETKEFIGAIDNAPDYIPFKGNTMSELEKNFHEAVDNYIIECERVGKKLDII